MLSKVRNTLIFLDDLEENSSFFSAAWSNSILGCKDGVVAVGDVKFAKADAHRATPTRSGAVRGSVGQSWQSRGSK